MLDLQEKALSISGIRAAPDNPPEAVNALPFAVSYPSVGRLETQSAGWGKLFITIFTELHFSRQLLNKGVEQALPYAESFSAKLMADPGLSSSVEEVAGIKVSFGKLEWGGLETIGWRFEVECKLIVNG